MKNILYSVSSAAKNFTRDLAQGLLDFAKEIFFRITSRFDLVIIAVLCAMIPPAYFSQESRHAITSIFIYLPTAGAMIMAGINILLGEKPSAFYAIISGLVIGAMLGIMILTVP